MLPAAPWRRDAARQRLQATVSGLGELDSLRRRQEQLVRAALERGGEGEGGEQEEQEEQEQEQQEQEQEQQEQEQRRETSSEDQLLEENILLLRKQLNCLRRRDVGLLSQLQELDQQISDLRLDSEASHDPPETDSRPSSGFYELSDGVSGSLSNSSNSVFSECLCPLADADGRLLSADAHASCLDCDELDGLADDSSSSGTVRRSLSAPHAALDPLSSCDFQFKYHCDLLAQSGGESYRYPSPLHAVAVQSAALLQMLGHCRDESVDGLKSEAYASTPPVPQSSSWPPPSLPSQAPPHKRLDSYIYSLVQRRALPVRTSRPRTSIHTDPAKSVLRQASLCAKHVLGPGPGAGSGSALGTGKGSELKPSWQVGGTATGSAAGSSLQGRRSVDGQSRENQNVPADGDYDPSGSSLNCPNKLTHTSTKNLLRKRLLPPSVSTATVPPNVQETGSPKETQQTRSPPDQEVLFNPSAVRSQAATPPIGPDLRPDSSAPVQEEVGAEPDQVVDAQQKNVQQCKGSSKNVKTVRVKISKTSRMSQGWERSQPAAERRGHKHQQRVTAKRSRPSDEGSARVKGSKRAAGGGSQVLPPSRAKRAPASVPEGRVRDKLPTSTVGSVWSSASRHHQCGSDHSCANRHLVAKPKYKRSNYQRLRAITEVTCDEASRRPRRHEKELSSHPAANRLRPSEGQASSPYSYAAGSDSEYSAECASLFHSTIMDTSEDERSNYTTNRFGDSESSEEYVEDSASASETEEKGGGGAEGGRGGASRGRGRLEPAGSGAARQEVSPAPTKAFIKIKASHNLKKKILRFRSGSLKLMTTM